jgi:hypothetical protein
MICNDEPIRYLKNLGYNVVRLPKADILPLQVFVRKGDTLQPLGSIESVVVTGENIPVPKIKRNVKMPDISGGRTSDIGIKAGLDILGNIIDAMGGRKTGLDFQYRNARTIAFQFQDVLGDSIEIAELDKYLNDASINPFSKQLKAYLDQGKIYVITSTIKSRQLSVEAKAKNKAAMEIDAAAISEVLGGQLAVKTGQSKATTIDFNGDTRLVFGFKAIRLSYKNGKYLEFEMVEDGGVAAAVGPTGDEVGPDRQYAGMLHTKNTLIDFIDEPDLFGKP